jgi:hypothetical protein
VVLRDRARELLALVESGREEWTHEATSSLSEAQERLEEAQGGVRQREAEVLRHRHLLAFLEDPEGYRPTRVNKKPRKAKPQPRPEISVIGGRAPRESDESAGVA